MNLEEIRRLLAQRRAQLQTLTDELRAMPSGDELTDEHRNRATEINTILRDAHEQDAERGLLDEIDHLEDQERTMVRALDTVERGGRGVEPGDERRNAPNVTRGDDDPFDITTMRTSPVIDGRERHTAELRARARAALERAQFPANVATEDEQRQRVAQLLERVDTEDGAFARHILLTGSPEYERAYGARLLGRNVSPEGAQLLERAMVIGNGADGGFAVMPFTLDPTVIVTTDGNVNPIREISRVEQGVTNQWKGVATEGVTATYADELDEAPDSTPELSDPTVNANRAHAFVPFSYELEQDWPSLRREITSLLQEAKDDLEAEKFLTGSGNSEPEGILTGLGTAQRVATASAGTFTIGDLFALEEALGPRFRTRAQFLGSRAVFNAVRQFDTEGGAALWERIGAATPALLLGYSAREVSGMDSDVTDTGGKVLIHGDFRHYLIYDRIGMSLELIPQVFGSNGRPTGQRGVYAFWRNGAGVLAPNAFRYLEVA